MITFENACQLMEDNKFCCCRIYDMRNNLLLALDDETNHVKTIEKVRSYESMLCGYGKIIFKVGSELLKSGNFKGAAIWTIGFQGANAAPHNIANNSQSPISQMKEMFQLFGMFQTMGFAGNTGNNRLELEIEKLKMQHEHDKVLRDLLKKNEDPIDKHGYLAPVILSAMGKKDEEIEKMMKWMVMGKQFQSGNNAAPAVGFAPTLLTFQDVDRMTNDQKDQKIESLISQVLTKVNAEDFIKILKKLEEKPELAITAVNFLPSINIPNPKAVEKHTATDDQLKRINVILENLPGCGESGKGVSAQHMILLLDVINNKPEILERALPLLETL